MRKNQPIQSCIKPPLWRGLARLLLSISCLVLIVTACSSDDDTTVIIEEIIGEWKLQDIRIGKLEASDEDVEDLAKEIYQEFSNEFDLGETIEFYDNGTGTFQGEPIKYSISKNIITMTDTEGDKLKFSYVIINDKLVLTINMKELIINEMADEFDKEELDYIKKTLKQFTIDFTCIQ